MLSKARTDSPKNERTLTMNRHLKALGALVMAAGLLLASSAAEDAGARHVIIYFTDGSRVSIPDRIADDDRALAEYCSTYFPGRPYARTETSSLDTTISQAWMTARYGAGSRAMSVRLVKLGLNESEVETISGERLTVPTRELTMHGNEDMAHHVAVVNAPRTGEASFRVEANGTGALAGSCKAGRIVCVLSYSGGAYTGILCEGRAGYIRTDCLIFHAGDRAPLGTGAVRVDADGVTVRAGAADSTAKVTDLPAGTAVIVHGLEEGWYAVECDGLYGYVPTQSIVMDAP